MIIPREHLAEAPCWWKVGDDGADFGCKDCGERGPASEMVFVLTPNGTAGVMHKKCVDTDWLAKAKPMPGEV